MSNDFNRLVDRFSFHPAKDGQPERYSEIRNQGYHFSVFLERNCPGSPELTMAINHIDQAVMWANAAIARNE